MRQRGFLYSEMALARPSVRLLLSLERIWGVGVGAAALWRAHGVFG